MGYLLVTFWEDVMGVTKYTKENGIEKERRDRFTKYWTVEQLAEMPPPTTF